MGPFQRRASACLASAMLAGYALVAFGPSAIAAPAAPAAAVQAARPACGNMFQGDILLKAWRLDATKTKQDGHKYAIGKLTFYVNNSPLEGGFDLRIQVWDEREVNWVTKDVAKKDVGDGKVQPCETFYLNVKAECGGKLSWRLRLWVAPGIAHDGTHTKPETKIYPPRRGKGKGGKQLDCL